MGSYENEPKRNWVLECGLDSDGSEYDPVVASCWYSDEPSGSVKDGKFAY
jgi:hypothetical protein